MNKILEIARKAVPTYVCTIDESYMVNVTSDYVKRDEGFAYIEEFRSGTISFTNINKKITNYEVWFCRFSDFETNGDTREQIREKIEEEAIIPFLRELKKLEGVGNVAFSYGLPRFSGVAVSIKITFTYQEPICL